MGRLFTRLMLLVFALALVAFALWVWPTRWRWDHLTVGGETYPVRIDRVSGHADVLLPGDGWTPVEEAWNNDGEPRLDGTS
jgi:hypothetical protein